MTKVQLYNYEDVLDAMVDAVKLFKDPLQQDTPLLFNGNVLGAFPRKNRIGLYSGNLAIVSLNEVPKITGVGERVATFTGELYISIPGWDEDSVKRCLRYCDISRGYFESMNLLGLSGAYTQIQDNRPHSFVNLDMAKVFGTKQPIHVRTGMTAFIVEKELDETVYTL